jgi:TRAP-type uncharacterized transport system fused permease subunit
MPTSVTAFRFALVGFTLPYMFVFRPELLMLSASGETAHVGDVLAATGLAVLGLLPLAAGISGYLFAPLSFPARLLLVAAAMLLLLPGGVWELGGRGLPLLDLIGLALLGGVALASWRSRASRR